MSGKKGRFIKRMRDPVYLLHITVPVLIAAISFFLVAEMVSAPGYSERVVASIDESCDEVLRLAGSATAVSVAITALPGDIATPVASTLAELNTGFLIVVCALYLEKFLMSATGTVVFQWLIPIACLIYIAGFLSQSRPVRMLSFKIVCFAGAVFLAIPAGAEISNVIRERYGESIDRTIQSAENSADLIKDSVEQGNEDGEAGNGLGAILKSLQQAGDTMARGTSQFMQYLEKLVKRYIEAMAVMLVTSCLIPVLVLLALFWLSRMIFQTGAGGFLKPGEISGAKDILRLEEKDEEENS